MEPLRLPAHSLRMSNKKRIIVTCPVTDVAVITNLTFEEVAKPRQNPLLFACPCGETHKLQFAGSHAELRDLRPPGDKRGAG
jgi:hypothetical protein